MWPEYFFSRLMEVFMHMVMINVIMLIAVAILYAPYGEIKRQSKGAPSVFHDISEMFGWGKQVCVRVPAYLHLCIYGIAYLYTHHEFIAFLHTHVHCIPVHTSCVHCIPVHTSCVYCLNAGFLRQGC